MKLSSRALCYLAAQPRQHRVPPRSASIKFPQSLTAADSSGWSAAGPGPVPQVGAGSPPPGSTARPRPLPPPLPFIFVGRLKEETCNAPNFPIIRVETSQPRGEHECKAPQRCERRAPRPPDPEARCGAASRALRPRGAPRPQPAARRGAPCRRQARESRSAGGRARRHSSPGAARPASRPPSLPPAAPRTRNRGGGGSVREEPRGAAPPGAAESAGAARPRGAARGRAAPGGGKSLHPQRSPPSRSLVAQMGVLPGMT